MKIGGPDLVVMAGPCSVESREQLMETARGVKAAGAHLLRGGAYKPRTSPYDFQGLGLEGLKILAEARKETGLPIVTEVMGVEDLDAVVEYADMMQVGARNMQNYPLLRRLATVPRPVLLKRGPSATIKEWLLAAEYLLSGGNPTSFCASAESRRLTPNCGTRWISRASRFARSFATCRWWSIRRTPRDAEAWCRLPRARQSPSAPTASSSKCIRARSARCPTARNRSICRDSPR